MTVYMSRKNEASDEHHLSSWLARHVRALRTTISHVHGHFFQTYGLNRAYSSIVGEKKNS